MTNVAPSILDYATACAKGKKLMELMRANDEEAGKLRGNASRSVKSAHLSQDAFEQGGWAPFLDDLYVKDETLNRLLEGLEIDRSANTHIGHHHKGSDVREEQPTTNAHFNNVVNPPAGMIAAVNSRSPTNNVQSGMAVSWEQGDELPDLRFWSDVAYLQWISVADESSDLRYVIRLNITNQHTKAVIEHIMSQPSVTDRHPLFPGISWNTDQDEEVAALLGTPNGIGVAWLLIQHKAQLGHKIVGKVTLVSKDRSDHDNAQIPSLIFELRNATATEKTSGEETAEEKLLRMRI